ncbi:MAG: hypothetical protein FJY98_04665 [Candidatus Liptonbacteria bacterium]|nr:hypothetical protein [Candidatus Liptonbacteria bacterium]
MEKTTLFAGVALVFIVGLGIIFWTMSFPKVPLVTNFAECSAAGNPVTASYPAVCRASDGRTFTEDISLRKILPADRDVPTAGICAEPPASSTVRLTVREDVPDPRCQKVHTDQQLQIENTLETPITLWFGENPDRTIIVLRNAEYLFPEPVGVYLAPGVHTLRGTPRQGPEIWVVASSTKGMVCIQVITKARDPRTGETKEFPTPCDVPQGWEVVGAEPVE